MAVVECLFYNTRCLGLSSSMEWGTCLLHLMILTHSMILNLPVRLRALAFPWRTLLSRYMHMFLWWCYRNFVLDNIVSCCDIFYFWFNLIFFQDVKENPVMIYMKGVPDFPQCGFSSLAVRVLKLYGKNNYVIWLWSKLLVTRYGGYDLFISDSISVHAHDNLNASERTKSFPATIFLIKSLVWRG